MPDEATFTLSHFMEAVQSGDLTEVSRMLSARPEFVAMDTSASDERRALHYAVLRRDVPMVRLLMEAGADARQGIFPHRDATSARTLARDREYHDVLTAIEEEEQRRREKMIHTNGTVSPTQDQVSAAEPAVHVAIKSGDARRVRELILVEPDLLHQIGRDGGLLSLAVKHGQTEIVKLLLNSGADVNERILLKELEAPTESWGMPLWHAALANHFEIAKLLLDRGADPNANVYASGWPLRNAWDHSDPSLKNLLLERGAKRQPYMVAEQHDASEAARLLSANPTEELARELAWSAADNGCPEIVEMALPHLHWPRKDPRWHWILIQPVRGAGEDSSENEGHFKAMAALLRHGVDPNITRFGAAVLHFTAARQSSLNGADRARFASMLLDYGARLDLRDDLLRSTPLGWACRWGRGEMVQLLIDRGADVNEPDAEAWATPIAWAKKMDHASIMAALHNSDRGSNAPNPPG